MEWFGGGRLRERLGGEEVPAFASPSSEFALTRATVPRSKAGQVLLRITKPFREPLLSEPTRTPRCCRSGLMFCQITFREPRKNDLFWPSSHDGCASHF